MEENKNIENQIRKLKIIRNALALCIIIMLCMIGVRTYKFIENKKEQEYSDSLTVDSLIMHKPIIYIYPQEETEVSVKVGYPENLTCTYPKYENGWDVIASPDGNLKDVKTGRNLYALYWEGIRTKEENIEDGFVVKGENVASFLEEKLEILGLNEREAEEFIVYWLPILEKNEYNFIRFYEKEEIDEMMPLEINPEPETLIRVLMGWKKLDKNIDIKEQKLEKVQRTGYTVVEWGGTEIKGSVIK